jgi:hypothetical protein
MTENNGLIGTIPTELGQMSGLVELYLRKMALWVWLCAFCFGLTVY